MGNNQKYVEDFYDTFAPVAKMTTVRTLLAVATIKDWHTIQMDVTNAFLHGDLSKNIYMKLPTGYTYEGYRIEVTYDDSHVSKPPSNLVC